MFQTNVVEKFKTRIFCSIIFFPKILPLWDNVAKYVEPSMPQITIRRMRIACWIPKATNTHSEHVLLTACPLQQRLHELALMLRYMYIAYIVTNETGCVYCAVRAESLNTLQVNFYFQSVKQPSLSILEIRTIVP